MAVIEKEFTCISPEYVKYFKCEGDICHARCCRGFQVDIDRQTHEKYKSIKDKAIRSKILNTLTWNKSSNTYRMKLDKSAVCPMLQDDCLCFIQKNFGHEFLSDVCADYPRRTVVAGSVVERSMALTCPIAARLALLNPEPMKFEETKFKTTRSNSFFYRSINEVPNRKYLLTIQNFSMEILQDRRLSINNRLAALGMVLSEVDALIANGRADDMKYVANIYHSESYFKQLQSKLQSFKFNRELYMRMMLGLMEKIVTKAVVYFAPDQRNFAKYMFEAFGFTNSQTKPMTELLALYDRNVAIYKKNAHNPFNHVLENYIVHSFFAGIYPCYIPGSLFSNYLLFLTLYKFFEFDLISMTAVMCERFSIYDLLELAERFCNRVDHATSFQQITLDYLASLKKQPVEFLISLIDFEI